MVVYSSDPDVTGVFAPPVLSTPRLQIRGDGSGHDALADKTVRPNATRSGLSLLCALACLAAPVTAEPDTRFRAMFDSHEGLRLTSEVSLDFGAYAIEVGATSDGSPEAGTLSDFHLIASRRIGPHLRFGLEARISNDDALDGARAAYALRALATRGDRALELSLGGIDDGPPGALFYTVKVSENWGPDLRATGRLHRYSTNDEDLDYYVIGLDGTYDLGGGVHARAGGLYRLTDDHSEEGRMGHLGLGFSVHEDVSLTADLVGRDLNGELELSAALSVTIAVGQVHFDTDVFGQTLAVYGH